MQRRPGLAIIKTDRGVVWPHVMAERPMDANFFFPSPSFFSRPSAACIDLRTALLLADAACAVLHCTIRCDIHGPKRY
jgi:hypothetical protein